MILHTLTSLIDNLTSLEMKESLNLLLKITVKLAGISMVLEVLESSFKGSFSAKLHDLHHLQESTLKTKQVKLLVPSFLFMLNLLA